ncbi:hypothetical protein ACFV6F_01605 [Kitasatospora phosalacinea]|uniref:hypothetical protein n=1 Tax=Kitasatospora phosalacinea TaxID=2065 RepID=UPI00365AAB86
MLPEPVPAAEAENPDDAPRPADVLPAGRAALFAAVGTAPGAAGHHLATDDALSAGPLMLAATVLFGAALWAARRRRGRAFWLAWTLGGQGLLHLLLTPPPDSELAPEPAHHHGAAAAASAHHGGPGMLAAHLLAAVAVALLVHRADAVWWTLGSATARAERTVRRLLPPLPPLAPPPAAQRRVRPASTAPRTPSGVRELVHSVGRRGPPVRHAFA